MDLHCVPVLSVRKLNRFGILCRSNSNPMKKCQLDICIEKVIAISLLGQKYLDEIAKYQDKAMAVMSYKIPKTVFKILVKIHKQ